MKTKLAAGLMAFSVLCLLLGSFPARAAEGALQWLPIDKPGLSGDIVVSPSEVSQIAVGGRGTIYALDSANSRVYQSLNSGATWDDITSRLVGAGAVLPASQIAIAPDTTSTLAVVADSGTRVYLSTDSGSTWTGTSISGLTGVIQAIAISRQYADAQGSLREIAIGIAEWGNGTTTGQVWVFQLGLVSAWQDQGLTVDHINAGGEVSAIAYSPNYQRDGTLLVVASTGSDVAAGYQNKTWLCLGKRDTAAGTTSWGAFSGYPVEIGTASSPSAGDSAAVTGISSSLALPSDYSGSDDSLREVFVSYDRSPDASDDIYRLDDTTARRLNAGGGAAINISSLAYYGTTDSGTLLAGSADPVPGAPTVQVRRTSNPYSSSPEWDTASAPPSGPGNARVSWSTDGTSAYCGTGQAPGVALDESAFSMSSDGGDNWQQLSLMDTTLLLSDVAPAPDSSTLFIATYSSFGPEGIWRSASTELGLGQFWSRQLALGTTTNRVILRLSPDYATDYTIYAVEAGGNMVAVSHNRGNSWKRRVGPDGAIDVVVEDANTLYAALPGGYVRKSSDGAFLWGDPVYVGFADINMLALAAKGTILVGGRNGEMAYSTDGGATFTGIKEAVGSGDVQAAADAGYQQNGIIYAATASPDNGIWRWTLGVSSSWEQIDASITAQHTGEEIAGIVLGPAGTLYALRKEPAGGSSGGMARTLNPIAQENKVEFDSISAALPAGARFDPALVFTHDLPFLKISGSSGQNDLWSIDSANEIIYRFQDTLSNRGTAPLPAVSVIGPADNFFNPVSPITGKAGDITFTWSRLTTATDYSLDIAVDSSFKEIVATVTVSSSQPTVSVAVGPGGSGSQMVNWLPGQTYYWRVRATAPLYSAYSAVRAIVTASMPAQVPSLLSPANGAVGVGQTPSFSWEPVAGATEYRFILSDNASLAAPVVDDLVSNAAYTLTNELEFGRAYFWAVKAVAPVEGGWSAEANFTVKDKPVPPPPPVVVEQAPPPVVTIPALPSPVEVVTPSASAPAAAETTVPAYIWATAIILAVLLAAVVILIVRR